MRRSKIRVTSSRQTKNPRERDAPSGSLSILPMSEDMPCDRKGLYTRRERSRRCGGAYALKALPSQAKAGRENGALSFLPYNPFGHMVKTGAWKWLKA